jgi:hypothetical protein
MSSWCEEKSNRVVTKLVTTIVALRAEGNIQETEEIFESLYIALNDATKILAFSAGGTWKPEHAQWAFEEGIEGLEKVLVEYSIFSETTAQSENRKETDFWNSVRELISSSETSARTQLHSLLAKQIQNQDPKVLVLADELEKVTFGHISWESFLNIARDLISG